MGATIAKKSYDVSIREQCDEDRYLRIHHPVRGNAEELFSDNNTIANKFYKVQFANVCKLGYYDVYRRRDDVAYFGNMLRPVARLED